MSRSACSTYLMLDIDWDAARRHLGALEHAAAQFIFAAFPENPITRSDPRAAPRHIVGSLDKVARCLALLQRQGFGIFVTVNAMQGRRRLNRAVSRVRAVWAERDHAGLDLPLPPSLKIETSPGKRHDYLIIDPADRLDVREAQRINRQIARVCRADGAATDVARVLRLAGTWNLKAEPYRARIKVSTGVRYTATDILAAFPCAAPQAPSSRPAIIVPPQRHATAVVVHVQRDLAQAREGCRNDSLNRAAFRLGKLGLAPEQIADLLTPIALTIGLTPREIDATIRSGALAGAR